MVSLPRVIELRAFVAQVADIGVLSDHPGSGFIVTGVLTGGLLASAALCLSLVIPHFLVGFTS